MPRVLFYFLIFFSAFLFIRPAPSLAADKYAVCDSCGYCAPPAPTPSILPQNWQKCQECIYPNVVDKTPGGKETLRIDPVNFNPPTPATGHSYTMIGCVSSNLTSFRQDGAAASVVQTILSLLFSIVGTLSFLYLIYGSFLIITSQADPERLSEGKRTILGAIVGLIFAVSSVFIINLLASGILKIPGFG